MAGRPCSQLYSGISEPFDKNHAVMKIPVANYTDGLLAEILVAEGTLDPSARVDAIVPELRNSAFGDALGWILARVTGKDFTMLLSERIWSKIGTEQDAYCTVDGRGTPFAGGGLSAGLRDLRRIGQLVLNGGEINGERLFPARVTESIRAGGDKDNFAKAGYGTLPGGSYKSMWRIFHNEHGTFAARSVHGQTIYIDSTAEMVLVRFASHPSAKNGAIDPTSLPAYHAVAKYLMTSS